MNRVPGIVARGLAMGAADAVPGVSGGTIAFITGIYEELIDTLAGIRPRLLGIWWREGTAAFWRAGNFTFLVALLAGILTSLVLLAGLITWLLEHYPLPLWAFFTGLIAASVPLVLRPAGPGRPEVLVPFVPGVLIATWLALQPGLAGMGDAHWIFFASGALAICAMILPGISGSFILLLLGMYTAVMGALDQGDWLRIGAFMAGAVVGLLSFVQLLRRLLARWHDPVLGLMAGFMAGSLVKVWPWQWSAPERVAEWPIWPSTYAEMTGEPARLPMVMLAAAAGLVVAWLLSRASTVHNAGSR